MLAPQDDENRSMPKVKTDKTPVDLLTAKQAKAEYARLQTEIAAHDKRYYQQDRPIDYGR